MYTYLELFIKFPYTSMKPQLDINQDSIFQFDDFFPLTLS